MEIQQPIDYWALFATLMQRRSALVQQRNEVEVELSKLKQLILGVLPMLTEQQQKASQEAIDLMDEEESGLQDAIKRVFSMHKGEWLTVSHVRDYLVETGFDFRHYRANPLASIGTTLKRIAPDYLETTDSGSGTLYRRRLTLLDQIGREPQRFMNEMGQLDPDKLPEDIAAMMRDPRKAQVAIEKAQRIAKAKQDFKKK